MRQISVIMATYNQARFIRAALVSIERQAYQPLEIIVIDDGSTDETPAVVSAFCAQSEVPIRLVRQTNHGQAHAFNRGLTLARGDVIGFLDSDDLWAEDRLPAQLDFFHTKRATEVSEIGIVLGRKHYFADGVKANTAEMSAANQRPFHYSLGATLIARRVFELVGTFDETMGYVADWDWFARARDRQISMEIDPRVTLLGRIHGGNITQDRALGAKLTAEMIRRHLARSRARQEIGDTVNDEG